MSKIDPSLAVFLGLKRAGVDFAVSVPCINLGRILDLVSSDPEILHLPVTREEEGVGVAAGAWMGGKRPALLMQNSGLGNMINALASLNLLYGLPLLMIISHRGLEGESIAAQVPMGRLTPKLLENMEIPTFAPTPEQAEETIATAWRVSASGRRPAAVLLDLSFWREG
jgi:sulfopyruvate decarboxylase subunit alpha